ncbi:bile acid:sodium symporter family protein [Thalassotalea litorea]|uniref:Bile acid:sodium symporter family protein n=1 Tax=Thalassotalea litorea TaxID=2020715 RepID=A0A5R9IQJ6_9GAMM|nr:bile acid:sodium symporter family protein [Thalassotalea litorea]TLU66317.1 bile acid:sodium symporter family protein [Thalassotalea litorea]
MLKNTAFTLSIFIIVAIALAFPGAFQQVGDYKLTGLIVPLLMIIMFGMGTSVGVADFVRVVKMPKSIAVGLICQYSIMPFIGMSLATLSGLPPEIAAGIILVGCAPGGLASNVMAYISGANLALSLSLTAFSTLLAPFVTPVLMSWLAGEYIPIDAVAMFWSITKIVILPVVAGLVFNHFLHGKFPMIDKTMPLVSMVGIVVIIAIITGAGRDNLITLGFALIGIVALQNILGLGLGYFVAKLVRMDEASARAIAFEVGMQNSGLASGIAVEMGRVATMGIAPAVFGPTMNVNGSILASLWRKTADKHRSIEEDIQGDVSTKKN